MKIVGRMLARMINATSVIGMLAVALMMLQITIDVTGKYIFSIPVPATISLVSHYYMVIIAFLPLAFVEERDGHITVEVLTEFLPMRIQHHLGSWTYLLSAAVFGALAYRSLVTAGSSRDACAFMVELGMKIIIWPSYYLLPIGAGLMTAVLIYRWLLYVTGAKSGLREQPTLNEEME